MVCSVYAPPKQVKPSSRHHRSCKCKVVLLNAHLCLWPMIPVGHTDPEVLSPTSSRPQVRRLPSSKQPFRSAHLAQVPQLHFAICYN